MISHIPEILEELRQGHMIILVDDEDRENEGDLMIAAEYATPQAINFMATHGRGLICLALTPERIRQLNLPPMTFHNTSPFSTAFHVSIEARTGVTTGISAHDRARTIQVAVDPDTHAGDLVCPGHIFPLCAREGGVLARGGQTEGSVDLCHLAGLNPSAVICEIMNEDGSMARMPQLVSFAEKHGIKICTVENIIRHRRMQEELVYRAAETTLPTELGELQLIAYETNIDNENHIALVKGNPSGKQNVPVRIHSECMTGDIFHSLRCDCGNQLQRALQYIQEQECGVVVYMRQEGRGIGLVNKIKSYNLQDKGFDTHEANVQLGFEPDLRDYSIAAQILKNLSVTNIRLLTNNPAKKNQLEDYGLTVTGRIPLIVPANPHNKNYLKTKKEKFGHLFPDAEDDQHQSLSI